MVAPLLPVFTKAAVPKATLLLLAQVITPVLANVQSWLRLRGAYAVPPALPIRSCPEAGAVLGTMAACVCSIHPAAVTDVQAGAAVPAGAPQTYSLCAVVSV